MSGTTTRARLAGTVVAVVLALAACAGGTGSADLGLVAPTGTAPPTSTPTATSAPAPACDDPVASYAPVPLPQPGAMPAGTTMADIQARGVLRVGVSADTVLMGSRNPLTGQIEGFDIDVARAVAQAVFGDADRIQFRVITASQRIPVLADHEVDLVVRAFTITCARWEQIAFSSEYYHAGQKVLVERGSAATSLDDLAGSRVCAPAGTTTLTRLEDYPNVTAVPADTHTACLALFQQGQVDAITGDDTVLAGLAVQDPYARVVGEAISDEPYGVGVAADQVDLVRFVNAVLESTKADGRWASSYQTWLAVLGAAPAPPVGDFGRG